MIYTSTNNEKDYDQKYFHFFLLNMGHLQIPMKQMNRSYPCPCDQKQHGDI